eukprot:CAMPEP_0170622512 /NCGR_PEP_ID=MMETSP0224-20130122/29173_1 /TAXON_ID=285029 /ORGANISM="Togula jolla, Strain CCCM 725" /LENGTH=68 /DNA_ID=CAMNT_0010948841 /DNA_START=60 /DNA_END=262 /DNA_ORIENTATION=+
MSLRLNAAELTRLATLCTLQIHLSMKLDKLAGKGGIHGRASADPGKSGLEGISLPRSLCRKQLLKGWA